MEGEGVVSYLVQVGRKVPSSGLHTPFRKHQGELEATLSWPLSNLHTLLAGGPREKQGSASPHLSFTWANGDIHSENLSMTKCVLEGLTSISDCGFISSKTWCYCTWRVMVLPFVLMVVRGGGKRVGLRGARGLVLKPGYITSWTILSRDGWLHSQRLFLHLENEWSSENRVRKK